jgi:hypothetical protein
MSPRRADLDHEAGFITPVFAGLVLMLSLVAAGVVLLARQDLMSANRDGRLLAKDLWLEGVARKAALAMLATPGQPVLRWREGAGSQGLSVTMEPEDRKIDPRLLDQTENQVLIGRLVGEASASGVAARLTELAQQSNGRLAREVIGSLDESPSWRACANTVVSPYGRLSRLAPDSQVDQQDPRASRHTGEIWRIFVEADDGPWLDQIVQVSDRAERPVEILEQSHGRARQIRHVDCWKMIGREGDVDAIG